MNRDVFRIFPSIVMKKLLIALASLSIACSTYDLDSPTQDSLAGRWNLTRVNDSPLPFVFAQTNSSKVEILEDVLTLTAPNTFSEVTTVRHTQSGGVTTETVADSGTYEFNSYVVNFRFQSDGSIGAGTLTGRTMKITISGVSFTYTRER